MVGQEYAGLVDNIIAWTGLLGSRFLHTTRDRSGWISFTHPCSSPLQGDFSMVTWPDMISNVCCCQWCRWDMKINGPIKSKKCWNCKFGARTILHWNKIWQKSVSSNLLYCALIVGCVCVLHWQSLAIVENDFEVKITVLDLLQKLTHDSGLSSQQFDVHFIML